TLFRSGVARQALAAREMTEHGGAVVVAVAALEFVAGGQEGVATGRVDKEARAPAPGATVRHARLDAHVVVARELYRRHPAFLDRACALAGGIAKKDLVERRAPHLEGGGVGLVPGLAEVERNGEVVLGRIELGAVLRHADGL